MSRLGDTIRQARVKSGMSEKQLGKKAGFAESYIKEIESGRRIVSDEQAQRLLKLLGIKESMSTELEVASEPERRPRPRPKPYVLPIEPDAQPEATVIQSTAQQESNDAWLDALGGVVRRVPVMDENGLVIEHVLTPVIGGKIEGGAPDKVLYYRCPDDSLSGFRIHAGDLLLTVPAKSPVSDAFMLIAKDGKRVARKITVLEGSKLLLQSYDRAFQTETVLWAEIQILGRCVKLMRAL